MPAPSPIISAPITPCLTVGDDNELGLPAEAFAANRAAMAADIGGWLTANSDGYWGVGEDRWPHDTAWTLRTIYETPLPVLLATNEAITSADLRKVSVTRLTEHLALLPAGRSMPTACSSLSPAAKASR